MSVIYNPNTYDEGLVIALDAGNPKSYGGTGTTWKNMVGGIDGTMYSVTYTPINGVPAMYFNGVAGTRVAVGLGSDYFPAHEITCECWIRTAGLGVSQTLGGLFSLTYGFGFMLTASGQPWLQIYDNITPAWGSLYGTGNYFDDVWHHMVLTTDGYSAIIYVDGVLNGSRTDLAWHGVSLWPTDAMNIGRNNNDNYYWYKGYMTIANMYKRMLSDDEIKTNFNANRGRFGR
jgi:hypothetical protein